MNEAEWLEANARYLSAAVARVRALLQDRLRPAVMSTERPANETAAAVPTAGAVVRPRAGFAFFHRTATQLPTGVPELLVATSQPPPASPSPPPDLDELARDMMPPPALVFVAQRLGLSDFESNILLLCVAMELDTSIAVLCGQVQGDPALAYPTFALAMSLFDDPAWEALSPERPLRHWRLIEISQTATGALTSSALRADERIVNFLRGITYLDDRLKPFVAPLQVPVAVEVGPSSGDPRDALPASQRASVDAIASRVRVSSDERSLPVIQLLGEDAPSKRAVAAVAGQVLGCHTYRLDSAVLPAALSEVDALARLWQRESLLLPVALYVEAESAEGAQPMVEQLLARLDCMVMLAARHLWRGAAQTPITVDVNRPTADEQRECWEASSTSVTSDMAATLAEQFDLNLVQIREVARREAGIVDPRAAPLEERVWSTCRALTRPGLDLLARRLVSRATWGDLVLPAPETALLRQIADQVAQRGTVYRDWGFANRMSRGLGISVLFSGASGTGKTLGAEVLANHLRLDLFRIDLSAVMSKYIGETEANLRRLFDAAEGGGSILFFDEADALFGKRTEVKDSHDRYANIEINYLLQRMESYSGLAILATNMKSALDQAFLRRLRFVVEFPFPGVVEREAMWRRAFPAETPVASLDYARLARLNVTGGHIAVIALNAAFQSARAGTAVTMTVVLNAARIEFKKLERPVNETDFRWTGAVA